MVRKVSSSYQYYKYLENYSASFLRRQQTGWNYTLGRKSNFETLVRRSSINSMGYEEDFNFNYKNPQWFINFTYKIAIFWTIYYFMVNIFLLHDLTDVFYEKITTNRITPFDPTEQPRGYENLYFMEKELKYKWQSE